MQINHILHFLRRERIALLGVKKGIMKSKILPGFLRMVTVCTEKEKVSSNGGNLMSCDTDIRRRKKYN